MHHIKLKARGGNDEPLNLIYLCAKCHKRAHGEVVEGSPPIDASVLKELTYIDLKQRGLPTELKI